MDHAVILLRQLFEYVDALPSSVAIRESVNLYSYILVTHVAGMSVFAGLVLMMDLRLIGIGNMQTPFSQLQRRLFPMQVVGMAITAVSGLLLVYAEPMRFFGNFPFWIKVMLMLLASINAFAFHHTTFLSTKTWDMDRVLPRGARLAGVIGLALWAAVVVSGRLIAYNWFQTP